MKIDVCVSCGQYHTEYEVCEATGYAKKTEEKPIKNNDGYRDQKKKNFKRPPVDKMIKWEYRKN